MKEKKSKIVGKGKNLEIGYEWKIDKMRGGNKKRRRISKENRIKKKKRDKEERIKGRMVVVKGIEEIKKEFLKIDEERRIEIV